MSKFTRIALASLVSLGVILGIYTSVHGASLNARQQTTSGAHLVSGSMVNLDHYRASAANLIQYQASPQKTGHDCKSDRQTSPDD
jgi:hypothetical protein